MDAIQRYGQVDPGRPRDVDGELAQARWSTPLSAPRDFHGLRIASRALAKAEIKNQGFEALEAVFKGRGRGRCHGLHCM